MILRTIKLMFHSQELPEEAWKDVLQRAFHATRRVGFRHVEAIGQPLCSGPLPQRNINVKEKLLSVSCKYAIINKFVQ